MQIIAATTSRLPMPGAELNEFVGRLRREVDHITTNPEAHDSGDVQKYAKNVEKLARQPTTTLARGHLMRLADDLAVAGVLQVI